VATSTATIIISAYVARRVMRAVPGTVSTPRAPRYTDARESTIIARRPNR